MLNARLHRIRRLAPAILLPLLLAPTVAWGKAADPAGAVLTLPLRTVGGRPLVAVTIGAKGPYDFILDTGAAVSLVDKALAEELDLGVRGTTETGSPIGAPTTFEVTQLPTVGVGPLALGDQEALLYDFSQFVGMPDAPRGVLSYLAFGGYLLVTDYPGGEIRVTRGALPQAGSDVFDLGDGELPEIPVTIAGKEMRVHLDTGSPASITLPLSVADSLPLVAAPAIIGRGRTVNAEFEIRSATLDGDATIGPYRLERPEIRFIEGAPIGHLGNGFLSHYVVTIDPAERTMRLEEPAAAPTSARQVVRAGGTKRYGIRFAGLAGDRLTVEGVDTDSPAEGAGLKQGDVIVRMNGTAVKDLDQAERIGALKASPLRLEVTRGDRVWECTMTLD